MGKQDRPENREKFEEWCEEIMPFAVHDDEQRLFCEDAFLKACSWKDSENEKLRELLREAVELMNDRNVYDMNKFLDREDINKILEDAPSGFETSSSTSNQ